MRISDWSSDVCSSDLALCEGDESLNLSDGTLNPSHAKPSHPQRNRACRRSVRHPRPRPAADRSRSGRSEEHTSALQSLMRNSYAVFCLKKKKKKQHIEITYNHKHPVDQHDNK